MAIAKVTGKDELKGPEHGIHGMLAAMQEKIVFLPNYSFRKPAEAKSEGPGAEVGAKPKGEAKRRREQAGHQPLRIIGSLIPLSSFSGCFLLKRRSQAA
jgi:cobalt/nickel transport system permease protein